MIVVPVEIPVIIPLELPIVPTAVLLLLHVPPDIELANVIVLLVQTLPGPLIAPAFGSGFTVILAITKQPVGSVYVIFVPPAETPVTMPVDVTLRIL